MNEWSIRPWLPSECVNGQNLGTDVTGWPGDRTMEMNGGSTASYLARTPCIPVFSLFKSSSGSEGAFRLPGATWDHFRCAVELLLGHARAQKRLLAAENTCEWRGNQRTIRPCTEKSEWWPLRTRLWGTPRLPEDLRCALCLGILSDPVITPCQHTFCKLCVQLRWAKSRESYRRIASESYRSDSNR